MGVYSAVMSATLTAASPANLSVIYQPAATLKRGKIFDLVIGSKASPADAAAGYILQRSTALPSSGTVVAAQPFDVADGAASILMRDETPTIAVVSIPMMEIMVNQRATFRWVAAPGSELVIPAVNNDGIVFLEDGSTANYDVVITALFTE